MDSEAYKTSPFDYSSDKNYDDCSANFEFSVVSEDSTGQQIFFKAMNQTAVSYKWTIIGFGSGIQSYLDTTSKFYPFSTNDMWLIRLQTTGQSGCKDSLTQEILVRKNIQTIASVHEFENLDSFIQVYPNPASSSIVINGEWAMNNGQLKIMNTQGQLVYQCAMSN